MEEYSRVVLLFFCYSVIGWFWETVYCSLKEKKFVYRGFLLGPYCPVYGFGVLSILYFIEPYQNNVIILYILSTVVVTLVEYVTSVLLEKFFHATWWDYKDTPFNINGRVALPISLFWGVACVFIVKVVHPEVLKLESFLQSKFGVALPIILVVLLLWDLIVTVRSMAAFQKAMKSWSVVIEKEQSEWNQMKARISEDFEGRKEELNQGIKNKREVLKNSRNEWLINLKEKRVTFDKLPKLNFTQRRVLRNFSGLKLTDIHNLSELKDAIKAIQSKIKTKE